MPATALAAVSVDDSPAWVAGGGWRCLCRRCTCRRCVLGPRCGPGAVNLYAPWRDPEKGTNLSHIEWSQHVTRQMVRALGFDPKGQEGMDLLSVATVTLLTLAKRFDVTLVPAGGSIDGQFRGWAWRYIRCECEREARRLRNGGTFRTKRGEGFRAVPLPRCRNCSEVTLAETPRAWWGDDED